jgi:hypothetical protein
MTDTTLTQDQQRVQSLINAHMPDAFFDEAARENYVAAASDIAFVDRKTTQWGDFHQCYFRIDAGDVFEADGEYCSGLELLREAIAEDAVENIQEFVEVAQEDNGDEAKGYVFFTCKGAAIAVRYYDPADGACISEFFLEVEICRPADNESNADVIGMSRAMAGETIAKSMLAKIQAQLDGMSEDTAEVCTDLIRQHV